MTEMTVRGIGGKSYIDNLEEHKEGYCNCI